MRNRRWAVSGANKVQSEYRPNIAKLMICQPWPTRFLIYSKRRLLSADCSTIWREVCRLTDRVPRATQSLRMETHVSGPQIDRTENVWRLHGNRRPGYRAVLSQLIVK